MTNTDNLDVNIHCLDRSISELSGLPRQVLLTEYVRLQRLRDDLNVLCASLRPKATVPFAKLSDVQEMEAAE